MHVKVVALTAIYHIMSASTSAALFSLLKPIVWFYRTFIGAVSALSSTLFPARSRRQLFAPPQKSPDKTLS